jgi:hypothetical protein
VVATGQLHSGQSVSAIGIGPGSDARVIGKGHALDVAGLNVNGITLDNVALTSTNGILSAFDNVGFTGYSQASTRLTLLHPGGTQPFSMGNIDFGVPPDPEPTTGHYVSVGDTAPGDPNILSLTFNGTFTNALNHTTHYRLDGGAVIHWDAP